MATTYPEQKVSKAAKELMSCLVEAALANPKPPKLTGFRTGTEGEVLSSLNDDECCGGAAFIRVTRVFPSWSTPTPATTAIRCAQPVTAEFELSMWRCAPVGDISDLPRQSAWDELHWDLLNDRLTLMVAVCCFLRVRDPESVTFGEWQPVPVDGGCVGSRILVTAGL